MNLTDTRVPRATPVGLLGATFALWGWSVGAWWLGLALGVAAEVAMASAPPDPARAAARVVPALRLAVLGGVAWIITSLALRTLPESLYGSLRWLPIAAWPIAVAARHARGLRLADISRAVGAAPPTDEDDRPFDATHGVAALVLAAAATGKHASAWLYGAGAVLVAWALLARAPRALRLRAAAMLVPAVLAGQLLHVGISALQGKVEDWSTDLIAELLANAPDPTRERTRIGDLGRVKLSDRIVLRVDVERPPSRPLLLREASFDRYVQGEWQAARRAPRTVPREGEDAWTLAPGAATAGLVLRRGFWGGEGLLPLPAASRRIEGLPATGLERIGADAVMAKGLPRHAVMTVRFDAAGDATPPEPQRDLQVPDNLARLLDNVLVREQLRGTGAAATVAAIEGFFASKFTYSLDLASDEGSGRGIVDFLLRDRRGHCEYFATATVLLLRQAGIPARYVGGYSAQEYSDRERAVLVRARHAHAWATAWVDGRWVDVDTTPPGWPQAEAQAAHGFWAPMLDAGSWLLDLLWGGWSAIRWSAEGAAWGAAAAALGIAMAWFVRRRGGAQRAARGDSDADAAEAAWRDLEARMARAGHARGSEETARMWSRRLAEEQSQATWTADLRRLAEAYYAARFDPALPVEGRGAIVDRVRRWRPPPSRA